MRDNDAVNVLYMRRIFFYLEADDLMIYNVYP